MVAREIIAICGALIAILASGCAVAAYFGGHNKNTYIKGENDGGIKGDIKYMRNSFDELRLDVKEVARKQDALSERITRCEENMKSVCLRVDGLEEKKED